MGVVWLASHPDLGAVAVKFVRVVEHKKDQIARELKNETTAAAKMYHPRIVSVISTGTTPQEIADDIRVDPGAPYHGGF